MEKWVDIQLPCASQPLQLKQSIRPREIRIRTEGSYFKPPSGANVFVYDLIRGICDALGSKDAIYHALSLWKPASKPTMEERVETLEEAVAELRDQIE